MTASRVLLLCAFLVFVLGCFGISPLGMPAALLGLALMTASGLV